LPDGGSGIHQRSGIEEFRTRKHKRRNHQAPKPLIGISERPETEVCPSAQVFNSFAHEREFDIERRNVLLRHERVHGASAGRARGEPADDFLQAVEFKKLFCWTRHKSLNADCNWLRGGNQLEG
jgi:hypothetical protein